ncbi:DEAD/DEAH box helicase [Sinirhodobacter sp. WL0062]|uniref:DEAD/DEAH box helicase n=1 Tax=Rhodobacter flavimaris TaxID=2907145 RepID=A0ABS8YRV7_9RHOB|nr:DEAD/DEAH box helicase [Sinirhodobacter sp. WL0062]MCE5972601.1 DEAD/DEAH box helicase [Sinirhodobacter sp. WL0062]
MNPILLARHVQDSLREQVHTTLNSSSPAFDGVVARFMAEPGNFLKGPWISVDMPFRQIDGAKEGAWAQPFPEVPLKFAPYQHQTDAFARLSGAAMRSTLVATGTGSGKTESYLWPILDHCRRNKEKPGIKAILIYPMNALATDQARRIAAAISEIGSLDGVRAGIYADAEPQNPTHEVTADSVITHRETMRQNPPDILLTNYKMLDYLLLRGRDKPLWDQNDPETLRFLVVDEMHTFDGAQGADLALLLRRLKYRLKTPNGHLVCVGSSATLGAGEDARIDLRRYAETIFGEPFDEGAVVTETRKTPNEVFGDPEYLDRPEPAEIHSALQEAAEMDQAGAALRLATSLFPERTDPDLAFLEEVDPADPAWRIALGDRLKEHHLCQRVLKIIAEHKGPAPLEAIAAGLGQVRILRDWAEADHRALAELVVALVSWARSGSPQSPRPLFNVRLQLWIREMSRMVTNLPRMEAGGVRSQMNLFHALDLDRHALRRALPVVNCNRCGATAHVGRLNPNSTACWAPLEQLYEEFFDENGGQRIRLFYHETIDRMVPAAGGGVRIVKGLLDAETIEFTPSDHDNLEAGPAAPVWMYDPSDANGRIDRTCPACGQARGLLLFGMRAARLTTGITGTLYTSAQNEEQPEAKPRFLMFSDSVQDAAHRAAVAETRNALSVYQKSLFTALAESETGGMSLLDVIENVPSAQLDAHGPDAFTALFIPKEQTWRGRYQDLIRDGISITDQVFLDHMKLRLGWEYFVDLSYRAHFSHTLEVNGMAAAEVSADLLSASATRLASELRNELPGAPDIDPGLLTRFLSGVVQRMRRQGSVAHPYLASAVATAKGTYGLNWFAAAIQVGVGKTGTLPAPDGRRGLAPIPVTLGNSPIGFERITRSQGASWYRDWLFRSLGTEDIRYATDPDAIYPIVLRRLEADGILRGVNGPDGQNRHAWLIEPDKVTVSARVVGLICDRCGRQETTLAENEQIAVGSPCTRIGCVGHLGEADMPPRPALRRSLRSDRNHRVVAREHTGILETDERLRVETGFIRGETRWAPNLISATPTLEMGIDIGDLSTLLLGSVPPEEANYVQRMGRSGRRDGNALNMVLANARAHDLQFWEDPTPMLAGQVRPPGVFLSAEEVLLRQVTAFTLDAYVAASSETGDYGKVRDVLKRRAAGASEGFPIEWLEQVRSRGDEYATAFLAGLPPEVQARTDLADRVRGFLTGTDQRSIGWRIGAAFDEAASEKARLIEKREEATKELTRLRKRRAELTDEEFEKREGEISRDRTEINRLIRSGIDDVAVIKFLTDKGILPNYAFPEEGVKLTSILSRRNDTSRNAASKDEDGLLYVEYSRPASSALSEFAPGQFFYANGRQVQIERIEIGKEDLTPWTFCPSCSHVASRLEGMETSTCPRCGDEMWSDTGSHHDVVQLKSVISVNSEEKAAIRDGDQRDQRQFDRVLMPFHKPQDIVSSWFTSRENGAPFGFEFLPHCTFRDFNFGPKSTLPGPKIAGEKRPALPFRICRHCGTLQKPPKDEADRGTHPPNCKVMREPDLARDKWETGVFLMRKFDTEAMRIVIPVVGEADDDDLKSFVAAINLGMRKHFAGKVDHLRSTIFAAHLDGMTTVRSLYLYDAVPGGSGYLRQVGEHPDTMRAVISRAAEALRDCACNQEPDRNGCFRCVKPYRSQFGPGEPDRDRARQMMETILQKWDSLSRTETGIDESIRGALVESALEKRLLNTLVHRYGDEALTPQVLPGGRRGFVLRAGPADASRLWTIEPQVQIDARFKGLPRKRIDFLFTPVGRAGSVPVVLEMDGLEYHADTVAQDLLDRMLMIRSGRVRVWTLSWRDLDKDDRSYVNPLVEPALGPEKVGRLAMVCAFAGFAAHVDGVRGLQTESSLEGFWRLLDGRAEDDAPLRSILARGLVAKGRPLDQLPRQASLTEEGRQFLLTPELTDHVGAGTLDLYLACNQISPTDWVGSEDDLRLLLRAELPDPGHQPAAKALYTEAWRGLWRLVNLFQGARGFHLELAGLETLSPPDMSSGSGPTDADAEAWTEARALCDEVFHSLIDALIAAEVPGPDRFGDDLLVEGRVVGMMEFGWGEARLAVAETMCEGVSWRLIPFDPETGQVGETVTKVIQALQETKS